MISAAAIIAWRQHVPWKSNEQVEQDLLICRALVNIFADPFLCQHLAFRGGTALHKLYLLPQPRYSEDIDLVQITAGPFGSIADQLQQVLGWLGKPQRNQKANNFTLIYRVESELPPVQQLRLKVETNCREHFTVLGWQYVPFVVDSPWFRGECRITTYALPELLGTKLRALYQRRKGRDLFDLFRASQHPDAVPATIVACFAHYMGQEPAGAPSQQTFRDNLALKMANPEFLGDTTALLRPGQPYDQSEAYAWLCTTILPLLP